MTNFRQMLLDDKAYLYDGAYGTEFQARGLPSGASPEEWGMEHPDVVAAIHRDYVEAGARLLTTNTFGGTAPKLSKGTDVRAVSRTMAEIARRVSDGRAIVTGSVGPTGLFVEPLGPVTFREMVALFKEQIEGLVQGGVDVIKAETFFDLAELKAVVIAAREVCDLPIISCMTFESFVSLTGTPPETFVDTMINMGVDVVGTNCSAGPDEMLKTAAAMSKRLSIPMHVQPNAGLPQLVDGKNVFPLGPDSFAEKASALVDFGAKFVGGCCGSTPEHIRTLGAALAKRTWTRPDPEHVVQTVLTTRAGSVCLGFDDPVAIIGERINPTGKEQLTKELQAGEFTEALKLAQEQLDLGARILDVNVGAPMVKEEELLPNLVKTLVERHQVPLCFDSNNIQALEESLWNSPGSPLVNSISGEPGRMEELGPLCKKFGAPFILLPLKGKKLPVTAADRIAILEDLLAQADALGIPRRLIVVDALVLTVSSKPESARACFELIDKCRNEWGLATTMGMSNISFGLPARELINTNFMTMCMAKGATSFIANPNSARLQECLAAAEVLMNRDPQAERFIAGYTDWTPGSGGGGMAAGGGKKGSADTPGGAVIAGARDAIVGLIEAELAKGRDPFDLVNNELIPAIMEVGDKYERKEFFLPQLMLAAETMQTAFEHLKPILEAAGGEEEKVKVIMATVEGDIHDIGKNIVTLMLRNHGFEVIDLGKDVPAEKIVQAAEEHQAEIIGLSALMTTTMVRMADVIELVRERKLGAKVIIGGAVITKEFSDAIGADGFSTDAVEAVRIATRLTTAEQ